ncbi:MAG: DAK2 domain-containing protein, partial [Kineosporiaceae bacterium]
MLEALDARATRHWALSTLSALGRAREEIDALNVFPVPDGDTGTNLYLTVEAAVQAVQELPGDAELRAVAEAFARGALLGARGNSGIISAQLLRGWADVLAERGVLDADAVREAFARGDAQAWAAVNRPVEGTILTVSRAASQAASAAAGRLADVASAAVRAARIALERTPEQLEVLRRSGVVDAGGR